MVSHKPLGVLIETWVTVYSGDIGYTFHNQGFEGEHLRCRGPKNGGITIPETKSPTEVRLP